VEAITLSSFYQNISSWPASEAGWDHVAETAAQLLSVPFVAFVRAEEPRGISWHIDGALERPEPALIEEFTRAQIGKAQELFSGISGSAAHLKRIQLSGDRVPWRENEGITSLAIVNISGENRLSLSGGRSSKGRVDYGWLIVAAPRALGAREELLCLAVAQRLSSLAEIVALEAAVQLRNQFLSIASHELKTPLTSIYGLLQLQERMLRLKKEEPAEQTQERQASYLKMVIRQTQRLNELIDGLLDVSRIQNGRFLAEPSDTDVAALIKETLSGRLAVIALEAGVKLSVESPEHLPAWVDPVRMEEVLTNLVMNAIRFSPEGGVVWIRLRALDGYLRLTVRDQGPSVPKEDRERIFQPFERAQRTARFGGLGLGLFISRQIAQLHGGDVILADSLQGRGNLFEATFSQPLRGKLTATG
jgi:signal transduction histidine kinase